MAFYPRRRRGRAPKRAPRRYGRKKVVPSARLSKPMVKAVQKLIHKNTESKQAFHERVLTSYNSGINVTADATRVLPSIAQGITDYQRIGDQIKAQSLTVKGAIIYNPSTGQYGTYANARLGVRMMIVQPRKFSNLDDVQTDVPNWSSYLLKKGGTTTAFTGVLSDLWAPINSDGIIKYYDKLFYLDAPYQTTAVGSVTMGNSTKFFNINLKLRNKILKYDASVSGALQPTNYAPVLIIGYAHMDGSAADVLTTAIQMTYDTVFTYEDA